MWAFWIRKSFRLNQAFETTICFELLWTFINHFKNMNIITKWVLENSRKSSSPSVLYIVNTLGFFVTNVTISYNVWHFFHLIKFFNVLNYEFKAMCDTRIPYIVWLFNNSHHAHKLVIAYIVNHNLYDIDRPYIFYDLFNVTMDISSYKARSSFILVMSQPHFGAKCEKVTHTPKSGKMESSGTPENSEDDLRGQISSPWCILYINGKFLKFRCPKWARIAHLDICSPSYGQKKGRESNWQFDSWPLKVRIRPLLDVALRNATWR